MKKNKKIAVIGGDMRQIHIARYYNEIGYDTVLFANDLSEGKCFRHEGSVYDALSGNFLLILPLPLSRDKKTLNAPFQEKNISLHEIYSLACETPYIALPAKNDMITEYLSKDSRIIEYAVSESFLLKNARATVEGAISIAINETDKTVFDSVYAVTGYGRIGKLLVSALTALGAKVKLFARKKNDRILACAAGAESFDISEIESNIYDADVVINTVPEVIMREKELSAIGENTLIIELASLPGGVDKDIAELLGVRIINAQSLPGKFSPRSSALFIAESISESLGSMGVSL